MAFKRLVAIIILIIHLFPVPGQLLLRQVVVYRTHKLYEKRASQFIYSEDDLAEIKIPVDMPSDNDWTSYQPVRGRVDFDNASYNYFSIKIIGHVMYLMCAPYYESGHLSNENVIKVNGLADMPVPQKDHVPEIKFPVHQYESIKPAFYFTSPVKHIERQLPVLVHQCTDGYTNIPEQPPKAC